MKKIAIFLFFFSLVLQFSCKKDLPVVDSDTQSVIDNISADCAVQSIFSIVNNYADSYISEKGNNIDSNVIVSISPLYPLDSFPKTMIIDYCNGVNCADGKTRKGKIIATLNERWSFDSNPITAAVTTNNFFENNIQIIGSFAITCNGIDDSIPSFTIITSDAKLIFENSKNCQWHSTNTINWLLGFETINNISDDVFLFSGNNVGINCNEKGYESNITSSLKFENSCQNGTITQGKFELIPQDLSKRIIDFGNGDCDRKATVTINGVTVNVDF